MAAAGEFWEVTGRVYASAYMWSQPTRIRRQGRYYALARMSAKSPSSRAITPPKGRPTRSRSAGYGRKRVFGSTAQWIAVAILLVLAVIILWMIAY